MIDKLDATWHETLRTSPEGTFHNLELGVRKPTPNSSSAGISESHVLRIWWKSIDKNISLS